MQSENPDLQLSKAVHDRLVQPPTAQKERLSPRAPSALAGPLVSQTVPEGPQGTGDRFPVANVCMLGKRGEPLSSVSAEKIMATRGGALTFQGARY